MTFYLRHFKSNYFTLHYITLLKQIDWTDRGCFWRRIYSRFVRAFIGREFGFLQYRVTSGLLPHGTLYETLNFRTDVDDRKSCQLSSTDKRRLFNVYDTERRSISVNNTMGEMQRVARIPLQQLRIFFPLRLFYTRHLTSGITAWRCCFYSWTKIWIWIWIWTRQLWLF